MRIRMKASMSGMRNGVAWPRAGEEIDVPAQEGADLCAAGIAEPVAVKAKVETRPSVAVAETRKALVPTKTAKKKAGNR